MMYRIEGVRYIQGCMQLIEVNNILDLSGNGHPIEIVIRNVTVQEISLLSKESIFIFHDFHYKALTVSLQNCQLTNNTVQFGSSFTLYLSAKKFALINCYIHGNQGRLFNLHPWATSSDKKQHVSIANSTIRQNKASEAIIYVSQNAELRVSRTMFEENHSMGRGSIVFFEKNGSRAVFQESLFIQNYAMVGGVFYVQIGGALEVENSTFQHNFAFIGGLMYLQSEGIASFKRSDFKDNFAIKAGLAYSINSQNEMEFIACNFSTNGIVYKQDIIEAAQRGDFAGVKGILQVRYNLDFLDRLFSVYSREIKSQLEGVDLQVDNFQFQIVKATIGFSQGVKVSDQVAFLFLSSTSSACLSALTLRDLNIRGYLIVAEQSYIKGDNILLTNIRTSAPILYLHSDSSAEVEALTFRNTTGPLLKVKDSDFTCTDACTIEDVIHEAMGENSLINIMKGKFSLTKSKVLRVNVNSQGLTPLISLQHSILVFNRTEIDEFHGNLVSAFHNSQVKVYQSRISQNQQGQNVNQTRQQLRVTQSGVNHSFAQFEMLVITQYNIGVFDMKSSTIEIRDSSFSNLKGFFGTAVVAQDQSMSLSLHSVTIDNCTFEQIESIDNGGAIYLANLPAQITNSKFVSLRTLKGSGGAIYLACSQSLKSKQNCNHIINGNLFYNNSAALQGGALNYDFLSPIGLRDNQFIMNTASYGNNYASYPFKLALVMPDTSAKQTNSNSSSSSQQIIQLSRKGIDNLVSGEKLAEKIIVGIYDQDDQLVEIHSGSEARLIAANEIIIDGNNKQAAVRGVYEFSELKLIAKPNQTTQITIVSNVLFQQKIEIVTGKPFEDLTLSLNFRECVLGEITKNDKCVKCPRGLYSFNPKSKQCEKCLPHTYCEGGAVTIVEPGFWRRNPFSESVFSCPSIEACLQDINFDINRGGYDSKCFKGYTGRMCNICSKELIDGVNYGRSGAYSCVKCPSIGIQILQILGMSLGIFLYVAYLLNSVLMNPKRNNPQTVLIRILTNYFQAIMIVKELDLSWPSQVQLALNSISIVSSSQEIILSFDCIFQRFKPVSSLNIATFYIKVLSFGLLPLVAIILSWLIWKPVDLVKRIRGQKINFAQNAMVTAFILIYLMYPTITNLSFSLFNCLRLDDNRDYLRRDLSVQCWTPEHFKIAFGIGIPLIVFWVIGFPAYIFFRLRQLRQRLDEKDVMINYGLFFVGLNDNAYFWEVFINNARKVVFIMSSTLLTSLSSTLKCLLGILIIIVQTNLLHRYLPHIDPRFNQVEYFSQFSTVITLIGGLFFLQEEVQQNPALLSLVITVVLVLNGMFIFLWSFRFLSAFIRLHLDGLRSLRLCRCLNYIDISDYDKEVWEIRERVYDSKESDPDLKIARYLEKLEQERALKLKIDREKEIEQSLELRRRRGQSKQQMGSQSKANSGHPKVMIEKERASKSMMRIPQLSQVTKGQGFDSPINTSMCSGQNGMHIKKKLYLGENLKLENLFADNHIERKQRKNSSQMVDSSILSQNLPSKDHHQEPDNPLPSMLPDANDKATKVQFEALQHQNQKNLNEMQKPLRADRAVRTGMKITIQNLEEKESEQKDREQHEVNSCKIESYLKDSRIDFLENQFIIQEPNKHIDNSISLNSQKSFIQPSNVKNPLQEDPSPFFQLGFNSENSKTNNKLHPSQKQVAKGKRSNDSNRMEFQDQEQGVLQKSSQNKKSR